MDDIVQYIARRGTKIRVDIELPSRDSSISLLSDINQLDQVFAVGDARLASYREKLISAIGREEYGALAVDLGYNSLNEYSSSIISTIMNIDIYLSIDGLTPEIRESFVVLKKGRS